MKTLDFFEKFWAQVKPTQHWQDMLNTVEDSPWHREANTAVHTTMTIEEYIKQFFMHRTERQRMLTLMALLFHDFGKPEAEETLEKKEEPGVFYRRYAGHEPISGNEFMSFMCDHHDLRQMFFAQGYNWHDIRTIKVMIEHHLPYGLKHVQKRENLKHMIEKTLGDDQICFYDMLRSDAAGRISDDHPEKLLNVELWIENFQLVQWKPAKPRAQNAPQLVLVVGVSGAGKSTWIKHFNKDHFYTVFSEDKLRMEYYESIHGANTDSSKTEAELYHTAWNYCHLAKESKFDSFSKAEYGKLLAEGKNIIVDRMNHGRKARNTFVQPARDKGYKVASFEFFISEQAAKNRQIGRQDKSLSDGRVHMIYMQQETPWYGPEVDTYVIVPPTF